MKQTAAVSAVLVLFVGGFLVACGASGKKPGVYGSSTTVSGVGSGGLVGSGVGTKSQVITLQPGELPVTFVTHTTAAPGSPPSGLSKRGRILWQFEALLNDTFHSRVVSAHYVSGGAWNFACAGFCAPLSYWNPYIFTFTETRRSVFHLSMKRIAPGTFGQLPDPHQGQRPPRRV